MSRVAEALRTHFAKKMTHDPNWRQVRDPSSTCMELRTKLVLQLAVILSDACVPGEGEHKIMEFIRYQRTQEGYNPNANIAVYGLVGVHPILTIAGIAGSLAIVCRMPTLSSSRLPNMSLDSRS